MISVNIWRGTTPTVTVRVAADLTDMGIHLTFKGGGKRITKTGDDLDVTVEDDVTTIVTSLTQEDTLSLKAGSPVRVQVRAVQDDGEVALASTIGMLSVAPILLEGVLTE